MTLNQTCGNIKLPLDKQSFRANWAGLFPKFEITIYILIDRKEKDMILEEFQLYILLR